MALIPAVGGDLECADWLPGIDIDMRIASLIGISGVVLGWQYTVALRLRFVTVMHNSLPVSLYNCNQKHEHELSRDFNEIPLPHLPKTIVNNSTKEILDVRSCKINVLLAGKISDIYH